MKVCVTQSPEKGKANKALMELLSKTLGLKKSQIELISGETSHQKRFLVSRHRVPRNWPRALTAGVPRGSRSRFARSQRVPPHVSPRYRFEQRQIPAYDAIGDFADNFLVIEVGSHVPIA